MSDTDPIEPDDKDWTWVLARACPDCGFDATTVPASELGERVRRSADGWAPVLAAPDARRRPDPRTWSTTEYAAHVRDVHLLFAERLALVLTQDDPVFPNWDQDATAAEERYAEQDPADVAPALRAAADAVAAAYDAVPADAWARRARRSNGSTFTTLSLGRYHLHDVVHHAWDVRAAAAAATVAAYDVDAEGYRGAGRQMSEQHHARLDAFAARLGRGARVIEIGSGSGRDAVELERRGLSVRRTDVTPAFVELLRADGHEADVVDPLHDDLADPADPSHPTRPWAGAWANASLLHVARTDLPTVLARLAEVTEEAGALWFSVKEGDGDTWSQHGRIGAPRCFVLWREAPLRAVVEASGWHVEGVDRADGERGERWLMVSATRRV